MTLRERAGVLEMDVRVVERGPGMPELLEDPGDRALREEGGREYERRPSREALQGFATAHGAGG